MSTTYQAGSPETLRVKKLHPDAILPTKAHDGDFGYDMYALEDTVLRAGKTTKVRTGIAFAFPAGYGGIMKDRSSVSTHATHPIFVKAGVIDNGYRGECVVALFNPNILIDYSKLYGPDGRIEYTGDFYVTKGQKIAQMMLEKVISFPLEEVVDFDDTTTRGANGFGSSGR